MTFWWKPRTGSSGGYDNNLHCRRSPPPSNPVCDFQEVNIPDAVYVRNQDAGDRQNPSAIELIPRDGEAGAPRKVYLPSSGRLWQRDIRKSEAKELLMKKQKWTVRLWRCSVAAILLFLLLGLLEGGLVGLKKWHAKESEVASELEPLAEVVERKGDMLAKINQITTSQLLPFEMLDAINRVRPTNIYFTRFIAESSNALQSRPSAPIRGKWRGLRRASGNSDSSPASKSVICAAPTIDRRFGCGSNSSKEPWNPKPF